jgi:hypothetical protein
MQSCSAADQFITEAEPWHQAALFQSEDGTEGARKEYALYCGKHDHTFGKAGCSGVTPSERPLCFPLDTGDGLDCSQEVNLFCGVLDVCVNEKGIRLAVVVFDGDLEAIESSGFR